MKIEKKTRKEIAKYAKYLPQIPVAKIEIISGSEILTNEKFSKVDKTNIDPQKKYKYRHSGAISAINHERRMLNAFKNGGTQAVLSYIEQFKMKENQELGNNSETKI